MCAILDNTLVADTGAGINNDVLAQSGPRIDDRSGNDDSASADGYAGSDDRPWVNGRGQVEAFGPNQRRQSQPRITIPKAEDEMLDTFALEIVELFPAAENERATELCAATLWVYVVEKAGNFVFTL